MRKIQTCLLLIFILLCFSLLCGCREKASAVKQHERAIRAYDAYYASVSEDGEEVYNCYIENGKLVFIFIAEENSEEANTAIKELELRLSTYKDIFKYEYWSKDKLKGMLSYLVKQLKAENIEVLNDFIYEHNLSFIRVNPDQFDKSVQIAKDFFIKFHFKIRIIDSRFIY